MCERDVSCELRYMCLLKTHLHCEMDRITQASYYEQKEVK